MKPYKKKKPTYVYRKPKPHQMTPTAPLLYLLERPAFSLKSGMNFYTFLSPTGEFANQVPSPSKKLFFALCPLPKSVALRIQFFQILLERYNRTQEIFGQRSWTKKGFRSLACFFSLNI